MMNYFIINYEIYFRIYFWPKEIYVLNRTYYSFYIQFMCYVLSRSVMSTLCGPHDQLPKFSIHGFSKQE